jgi:hypothetical protein
MKISAVNRSIVGMFEWLVGLGQQLNSWTGKSVDKRASAWGGWVALKSRLSLA